MQVVLWNNEKMILVDYCDYNSQLLKGYDKVMRREYTPTSSDNYQDLHGHENRMQHYFLTCGFLGS